MSGEAPLPYRPNVGAVLFNRDNRVFVARRADLPNAEGQAGVSLHWR
jgi:putative (di)nucleoside polyphosphate hydrolase